MQYIRWFMTRLAWLTGLITLAVAGQVYGTVDEAEEIETFTPPVRSKSPAPNYPLINQRRGIEGWVYVNYMVDPQGKPYDITITETSADHRFESAAISVIEDWQFEPALLGTEPIDAGARVLITFELTHDGKPGARRSFIRRYRALDKAIQAQDRSLAEQELKRLEETERNLYEEAFYQLGLYNFALHWGTRDEQFAAIERATVMDRGRGYLPDSVLTAMLMIRLQLEVQLNKLAAALVTVGKLRARDLNERQQTSIDQIDEAVNQARAQSVQFGVRGEIDEGYRFSHRLLYPSFYLESLTGDVAEFRLHCDKGYVGFTYEADLVYRINPDWLNCWLTVIGDPGATFTVVETAAADQAPSAATTTSE